PAVRGSTSRRPPAAVAVAGPWGRPVLGGAAVKRYFEFVEGKSNKFWEITLSGKEVTTRYGKIGSDGRGTTKSFADEAKAKQFAEKIIGEKTGEGYVEKLK